MLKDTSTDRFIERLARPVCDALRVVSDDEVIVDWTSGRTTEPLFDLMSVTKSVVSVIIGRLFFEGILDDLDYPLAEALPAWRGTPRQAITLRHLMAHTSGLDCSATSEQVFASGDVIAFALEAELVSQPGACFGYNNRAVNLLSAVVMEVAARPLDELARDLLFAPLGIEKWKWSRDAKGTPLCMSGCYLDPEGLSAIGRLMLNGGTWRGLRLLSDEWCRVSTTACPPSSRTDLQHYLRGYGLLWWILYPSDESFAIDQDVVDVWRSAMPALDGNVLACMASLSGRAYSRDELISTAADRLRAGLNVDRESALNAWYDSTWRRGLPDGRRVAGSEAGFFAEGARGQLLLVQPDRGRVAIQLSHKDHHPATAHELRDAVNAL
jgi:CubicO group peptidase (beta-lactamase class C family)